MDDNHREKYQNQKKEGIIDQLLNVIPQVLKLLACPFELGYSSHSDPGNVGFQNAVLEFVLDNNVAFKSLATESFWNIFRSLFKSFHRFSRQ